MVWKNNFMPDEEISQIAVDFARHNKLRIAKELTDPDEYLPDAFPVSVFMAGSPGAGKTEFSKNLISLLEEGNRHSVVRIDGDELRTFLPGYTGSNSRLFQGAMSLIVEKMHDLVLHQKQSFVLDGTLAGYEKSLDNIRRSLTKNREVIIFYIYQKPEVAWRFTQAREKAEGRNIPKESFINQFLGARETVNKIAQEFGEKVAIFFVKKDFEKNMVESIIKIDPKNSQIDDHVQERYTRDTLEKCL
jgi:adenylylsulfate kinase-like enzyme